MTNARARASRRGPRLIGAGALVLCTPLIAGNCITAAGAKPLPRPIETTLHQAIEDAWHRLPQRADYAAQQDIAGARYQSGGAIVPNAPTARGSYVDDRQIGSHYNYVTSQVGVSTPLWLPGEGTATQRLATAEGTAAEAQAGAAHLALAAEVLARTVAATDAWDARDIAARRLQTAEAFARDLRRRVQVGENADSDALAAEAEAAAAGVTLAQAEAALGSAQVALATLTGSPALPLLTPPAGPPRAPLAADHPQILAATRQVEQARAQERLTYLQNRDDPEIGVQGINEKQPGTRWDTRVGVTFTFHFATEARNAPRRAAAVAAVTRAEVQLELTRRQIAAEIARAAVALGAAERARAAADRASAVLTKRQGQIERAWRLGEMPFIEVVRATDAAFAADAASRRARTGYAGAVQQLAIAGGSIP